jgi:V-type H+-transporting ATPase subunit C
MPSDLSYWLISAPLRDGEPDIMLKAVKESLGPDTVVGGFEIPELKVRYCFRYDKH